MRDTAPSGATHLYVRATEESNMHEITCTRCGALAIQRPLRPLGTADGLWGLCEDCWEEFQHWFAGGDLMPFHQSIGPTTPDHYS